MLVNLFFAIICGGLFGIERKIRHKSAGLKTLILICMGSTLFTDLSLLMPNSDPLRVMGQIITGIGFLGAGCIIRGAGDKIGGLTTASIVWMVSAIGVMCGLGLGIAALFLTVLILGMLWGINWIEHRFFPLTGELLPQHRNQEKSSEPREIL